MKSKKYILIILVAIIFLTILSINKKTYAMDLDEIERFNVTVDPRMSDGSLDITYEIKWKVLDSTTEGPLEWVQIGTPNASFDTPTALSDNIASISQYNGSYVKIVFTEPYQAGETVTFKYSIHQSYMYKLSGSKCKYEFTPAWFPNCKVDKIEVKWNNNKVKKSDTRIREGNYLVWSKENLEKGEKINTSVTYKKKAFSNLDKNKQRTEEISIEKMKAIGFWIVFALLAISLLVFKLLCGGDGYFSHSGFGYSKYDDIDNRLDDYSSYDSSCVSSSGGCASSSCACACACAGSGRAGCSKKDFYGTNLRSEKIKKAFKK